jgi:hypothetical protein
VSGSIYALRPEGDLVELTERAYDSEALLQRLLADHPRLLAGDQIDGAAPRRWLLVTREAPLGDEEGGPGRWAVDHLFLDQDGVPTLVEVKRSADTRIRREVVGQLLDYAAHAGVYWSAEDVRVRFEAECGRRGRDAGEVLGDFLGVGADPGRFWQLVKTNLEAGRLRLLFVADEIPARLRRVVEFLNGQMSPAEGLAVEIRQYAGPGLATLVPRVLGQTVAAQQRKAGGAQAGGYDWDETSFYAELEARRGAEGVAAVRRIQDWAATRLPRFAWRWSGRNGVFWPCLDHNGHTYWPVGIRTDGRVEVIFQYLRVRPPFADEALRRELLRRVQGVPGVVLSAESITGRPSFALSALYSPSAMEAFLGVLDWVVDAVKR